MSHPIRKADIALNSHFGGTYTAYLVLEESHSPQASERHTQAAKKAFLAFADQISHKEEQALGLAAQVMPLIAANGKGFDGAFPG